MCSRRRAQPGALARGVPGGASLRPPPGPCYCSSYYTASTMAAVGCVAGGVDYLSGLPAELLREIISLPKTRVLSRESTRGSARSWGGSTLSASMMRYCYAEKMWGIIYARMRSTSAAHDAAKKKKLTLFATMQLLKSATLSWLWRRPRTPPGDLHCFWGGGQRSFLLCQERDGQRHDGRALSIALLPATYPMENWGFLPWWYDGVELEKWL